MKKPDMVEHPPHYNLEGLPECIDIIEGLDLPYHLGNCLKYIWRHGHKDKPLEDLRKARWYLDRYIERVEKTKDVFDGLRRDGRVLMDNDNDGEFEKEQSDE